MRTRSLGVALIILAACDADGTSGRPDDEDPATPDAATASDALMPGTPPDGGTTTPPDGGTTAPPDATTGDGCASPPMGNWAGSSTNPPTWDDYGPLDGDVVAGALVRELSEHTWRLER